MNTKGNISLVFFLVSLVLFKFVLIGVKLSLIFFPVVSEAQNRSKRQLYKYFKSCEQQFLCSLICKCYVAILVVTRKKKLCVDTEKIEELHAKIISWLNI